MTIVIFDILDMLDLLLLSRPRTDFSSNYYESRARTDRRSIISQIRFPSHGFGQTVDRSVRAARATGPVARRFLTGPARSSVHFDIPLRGPGGEPVDLLRTLTSHGLASLPPLEIDEERVTLTHTLAVPRGRPRTIRVSPGARGRARVDVLGRSPGRGTLEALLAGVHHVLHMDEDLSVFYELTAADPDLSWVARGAGRMIRSPSVFEEVVRIVCTTNCSWAATTRMLTTLVQGLGERTSEAPSDSWRGRAFPNPEAMAAVGERFYREEMRAGYRGPYLLSLARSVAEGTLDLEALGHAGREELSDDEMEARLLALPGVGPYAAAHIMLLLGRYSRLILDSWTRPKYARLRASRRQVSDASIVRRFRRYGEYSGLAFWCYLTRDWVND
ncbi:MAG TPA: Fe-S cluster assembly protein HesB [Actinomycetota bacterium]|nr:Fe-S cluster assembly protein HesB [Actinomycetota bacterium]